MITCVGSIALDTTNTPSGKIEETPGGSATYFALAASLVSKVSLVSCVGADFPKPFLEGLGKKGIETDGIRVEKTGKTMRYHSTFLHDFNERRSDLTALNVFEKFEPELSQKQAKAEFAYLGTLTPAIQLSVIGQLDKPKFVAMDTIEYFINNDREGVMKVLSEVDCAVFNDSEARLLCRNNNIISCGKQILKLGPSACVIKKGEHGSILFLNDGTANPYPAFPLETVIDPTGAGDAFAGGFMGHLSRTGYAKKDSLRKAMAWGTTTGSIAVESMGTQSLVDADFESALARYNIYKKLMHYEEA